MFSFKLRGAYNRIAHLSEAAAKRGVICASAGNHAQGVALAAKRRGVPGDRSSCRRPRRTSRCRRCRTWAREVVLHGDDYDSAFEHALVLARERNLIFVHPFDDPDVIAGQGTIGVEILRQTGGRLDAIFVPVGGGGLIAGIAVYVKYLYPNVRIIGVEPEDAAGMYESLRAGQARDARARRHLRRRRGGEAGRRGDLRAVPRARRRDRAGRHRRDLRRHPGRVRGHALDRRAGRARSRWRASRSTSRASGWQDKRIVAINSGANMNFDRLRHVAERADLGGEREALLAVVIPEEPGSFLRFCEMLGKRSVTEFNYRYETHAARADLRGLRHCRRGTRERDAVVRSAARAPATPSPT